MLKEMFQVVTQRKAWSVPSRILAMLLGIALIYSILFSIGYWIYGQTKLAISLLVVAAISGLLLSVVCRRIKADVL